MHNIHPFFLTDNALYILVLDATKDQNPRYWLNYIKYYANNAPVMIVNNKTEGEFKNKLEINTLRYEYQNILHDDYKISCKENIGIEEFKKGLDQNLQNLHSKNIDLPYNWIDTKNEIQETYNSENFNYDFFIEVCEKNNILEEKDQYHLLTILNNLGIVLTYKKSEDYNTLICNPKWLTYAIYNIIINKDIEKQQGITSKDNIKKTLLDKKLEFNYSRQEINFIIELLIEFQLSFYNKDKMLVFPNHLSQCEVKHSFNTNSTTLNFNYKFEFYPISIFTILLSKLQRYSHKDLYWRHGILLRHENILALVKENINDKKIHIYIQNEKQDMQSKQRDFLQIIREKIKNIISGFNEVNFKYSEYVFYNGIELDYQNLLGYEEGGAYEKFIPELKEYIDVKKILNGFVAETIRSKEYKYRTNYTFNIQGDNVNYKQTIKDNATVENAVMAKKIENSFSTITQSKANEDLKKLLILLTDEALKIKNSLEEDKIDDFLEDVELLTKQAVKEKPNKKQLNISIEGIMDATKSVGEVGNILLELLPKIGNHIS